MCPYRKIWEEAYNIVETKLSGQEKQWLKEAQLGSAPASPKRIAEEAQKKMKTRQLMPQDVRNKIERVLNALDNYAGIIDVGIQHSPEITYVCSNYCLAYEKR